MGFFLDTIKAKSFKLYIIISLLWIYIVSVGLMALTLFSGHRCVRNINCQQRVLGSDPLLFKCYMAAPYIERIMHNMICVTPVCYQVKYLTCLWLVKCLGWSKTLTLGFTQTPYNCDKC